MHKGTAVALALAFVSLWIVVTAGVGAIWSTAGVRALGLVLLPTGAVAALLVGYFEWRDKLRRRMLDDIAGRQRVA